MGIRLHLFHRKRRTRATQSHHCCTPTAIIEGRRHRTDVPYLLPKDHQEIHRLDFQHFGLKCVVGANYKAPLDLMQVHTLLDVGSGTGRWMSEMAQEVPHARIDGIDIEPPASYVNFPSNCFFQQGNILQGLPYPDHAFDYVHQRLLVGAIPTYLWPFTMKELVRITRIGGWVELLEAGRVFSHRGPATTQLNTWWDAKAPQIGFDLALMPTLDELLMSHGLQHVHLETIQIPLGKWAGRAGDLLGRDMYEVFKGFKGFYVGTLGVDPMAFDQVVSALPGEWEQYKTTYEFYLVYGQKCL
ncbi:class I SAM-dependent methyltransferase [Dictyobacter aurantiacus]|uniref:Methyltransferase domain-containing protein n=1 Tax=Dictyobacter aurantiacus TaxID=1936993 RepID=A0A401ZQU3_9CHLR|nr:class I SAM-dependent methyltransferase [Dictyobacter aurantiacus]GCE09247.1 hypothetical protein KDAU_65760 [Dictyobacter aurantiacus]